MQFLVASNSRVRYHRLVANNLTDLIKQKQAQITKLQTELDEARKLLTHTQGQVRTLPDKVPMRQKPVEHRKGRGSSSGVGLKVGQSGIVPTSSVGLTVEVLHHASKPLPVDEIIRAIEARGQTVKKTTLVGNLSRYIKAKKVFYRAGPNVYGLLEWKKS